jgi:hypothetical protein
VVTTPLKHKNSVGRSILTGSGARCFAECL